MTKTFGLFLALALLAGSASASDRAQQAAGHTVLRTSHNAQCSTPSGKASRECARASGTHASSAR